VMKLIN